MGSMTSFSICLYRKHTFCCGLRKTPYKHEECAAIVYLVYPGVKLKALVVYVAHINL